MVIIDTTSVVLLLRAANFLLLFLSSLFYLPIIIPHISLPTLPFSQFLRNLLYCFYLKTEIRAKPNIWISKSTANRCLVSALWRTEYVVHKCDKLKETLESR